MKVSAEEKSQTHERIIHGAKRLFRSRGISTTSVADVMNEAGLTHGGFYRHFQDKAELLETVIEKTFGEIAGGLSKSKQKKNLKPILSKYAEDYLSSGHINHPEIGCPISTLGPELSREDERLKEIFSSGFENLISELKSGQSGSEQEKTDSTLRTISMLVGAVVIARASNPKTAKKVITACKAHLKI